MTKMALKDIEAEARDLVALIETIQEQMFALDFGSVELGTRDDALARISALINIARDVADKTADDISENYEYIQARASERGAA